MGENLLSKLYFSRQWTQGFKITLDEPEPIENIIVTTGDNIDEGFITSCNMSWNSDWNLFVNQEDHILVLSVGEGVPPGLHWVPVVKQTLNGPSAWNDLGEILKHLNTNSVIKSWVEKQDQIPDLLELESRAMTNEMIDFVIRADIEPGINSLLWVHKDKTKLMSGKFDLVDREGVIGKVNDNDLKEILIKIPTGAWLGAIKDFTIVKRGWVEEVQVDEPIVVQNEVTVEEKPSLDLQEVLNQETFTKEEVLEILKVTNPELIKIFPLLKRLA